MIHNVLLATEHYVEVLLPTKLETVQYYCLPKLSVTSLRSEVLSIICEKSGKHDYRVYEELSDVLVFLVELSVCVVNGTL